MICKLCVSESELANPWRSYTYIGVWMLELCFGIFRFGGISSRQMRILISNVRGARFESAQAWNSVSNCLINVGFVGLHLGPLVFGYLLRWGWNFIVGWFVVGLGKGKGGGGICIHSNRDAYASL